MAPGAGAHASEVSRNAVTPSRNTRRRPARSHTGALHRYLTTRLALTAIMHLETAPLLRTL
ncbi:hypothetical protein AMETH_5260 [Amycolatopsis methanolica 239]|uniref:Uncharacterized protein n=1 Tax=Amycolatopsis methanolica 239 TaxID=1068978 RepID=A0A076N5U1_AMYME|nr:hypothetical protein AMETH_5260 [Amycolatopsis methanolica 239]